MAAITANTGLTIPSNIVHPSLFDKLPPNLKAICLGERTDLTEAQRAIYARWCKEYSIPKPSRSLPSPNVAKTLPDYSIPKNPRHSITQEIRLGVGDYLHQVLVECKVNPPCVTCGSFMAKMNGWGIEGCKVKHRQKVIDHLNNEYAKAGWLDRAKVALKGYLSTESLLDEAVKIAESKMEAKQREKAGEPL